MSKTSQGLQLKRATDQEMRHFRVRFFRARTAGAEPTWTAWHPGALPKARYERMYEHLTRGPDKFQCEIAKAPQPKVTPTRFDRADEEVAS